jgi:NAD(P)-dependent dehydrogenase (short-subunit alcohol dehydrogenase family)
VRLLERFLTDQVALLTGASRGIGRALAWSLVRAGAKLGLVARNAAALEEIVADIRNGGGQALALPGDLANRGIIPGLVERARQELGEIDLLIHVAGIQGPIGPFQNNDLHAWEQVIRTNFLGAVWLLNAVLPSMIARRRGKIINFSGGGATAPRPNFSAYAASKAALVRFTETLAVELKPYNIQANAVAPGAVNTQMLDEVIAAGDRAGEEYHQALKRVQTGGTPVELVCELVLFLASPASGKLTGKLISAPHDPWREWVNKDDKLNDTPLYTIRRLDPFTIKPLIKDLP